MMRIVVLSDTHGRTSNFERLWRKQQKADLFIHLGDGVAEVETMCALHRETAFVTVRGNCDFGSTEPTEKLMELEERRVFFTHGHRYGVKGGIGPLLAKGLDRNADVILFGHTHSSYCQYIDGVYVINPGSLEFPRDGRPSFGVIELASDGMYAFLRDL